MSSASPDGLAVRYAADAGRVYLSGVQAIVRFCADQARHDQTRARTATGGPAATGGLISGYQGSPLGGLDKELLAHPSLLTDTGLIFRPGLNEELAVTSVYGSQMALTRPTRTHRSAFGVWYGKAPGVDRSADAIRHANLAGAHPDGGVVLCCGDDPAAKSSTVPSASEPLLAAMHVPVLYPADVADVIRLGRHAVALSRHSGLWCALKIVTAVADATRTVIVSDTVPAVPSGLLAADGRPYVHRPDGNLLPPASLALEQNLHEFRLPAARAYAHAAGLDRISGAADEAWLGVAAAGRTFTELRQALADIGMDDEQLARRGVRLLQIAMPFPLDQDTFRDFSRDLSQLLIVEEKSTVIADQAARLLYDDPCRPQLLDPRDEHGRPVLSADGELDAGRITRALAVVLDRLDLPALPVRIAQLDEAARRGTATGGRPPAFCSGCPHGRSTRAPDSEPVGAGIGCHTMVLLNPDGRGDITGITQMGGEGAQWIGMAPFVSDQHFTQNLGDGTFHHSGSLAIRAAVAAGEPITYKLLYNDAVAMTGGQDVQGQMPITDLIDWCDCEGVSRVVVVSEDPGRHRDLPCPVVHRDRLDDVQRDLAGRPGVSVLIYDQRCALEKRRLIRKGRLPRPAAVPQINRRVCEGCGDCSAKSGGCRSVEPVATVTGEKMTVNVTSCAVDLSCADGDCPSFLMVSGGRGPQLPECPVVGDRPHQHPDGVFSLRLAGVGGTGVVTVSQVLGMACHLGGLHVAGTDQTGLSQKGGPVISDLTVSADPGLLHGGRVGAGQADVLLGLDGQVAGSTRALAVADPARTRILTAGVLLPGAESLTLDAAALSRAALGSELYANMLIVGAACQLGWLPVPARRIAEAVTLNGADVQRNLLALDWGRALIDDPALASRLLPADAAPLTLDELTAWHEQDLRAWGGDRPAAAYRRLLDDLDAACDRAAVSGADRARLLDAAARGMHHLTAYKDEYEVARLHLDAAEQDRIARDFGADAKVRVLLHPPLLRRLGLKRKLQIPVRVARPLFRTLIAMRGLRGTWIDPFGRDRVRRSERRLAGEYAGTLRDAATRMTASDVELMVKLADGAQTVCGYEHIKLASIARYRDEQDRLLALMAFGMPAPFDLPVL